MSTIYTLNGKVLKNSANDKWLIKHVPVDPYNPLGLPPFTIRCKFTSGYTPTMGDSQMLVDAGENIWDITKNSTNWRSLFSRNTNLISILGANTTGVTDMSEAFYNCTSLTALPLIDTSSVTKFYRTFSSCSLLSSVPLLDTSSCNDMRYMFSQCRISEIPLFNTSSCTNMESTFMLCSSVSKGALAIYQQVSTQANIPTHNENTFYYCGANTVTGAAELAQIPSSWGGTGA